MSVEGSHPRHRATRDFPSERADLAGTATLCPHFRDNVYAFYRESVLAAISSFTSNVSGLNGLTICILFKFHTVPAIHPKIYTLISRKF